MAIGYDINVAVFFFFFLYLFKLILPGVYVTGLWHRQQWQHYLCTTILATSLMRQLHAPTDAC